MSNIKFTKVRSFGSVSRPRNEFEATVHMEGRAESLAEVEALIKAAPEMYEICIAYRNLLKTMAQTDGEVATFHHVENVLAKARGES